MDGLHKTTRVFSASSLSGTPSTCSVNTDADRNRRDSTVTWGSQPWKANIWEYTEISQSESLAVASL